jgi:hypothetical protein
MIFSCLHCPCADLSFFGHLYNKVGKKIEQGHFDPLTNLESLFLISLCIYIAALLRKFTYHIIQPVNSLVFNIIAMFALT